MFINIYYNIITFPYQILFPIFPPKPLLKFYTNYYIFKYFVIEEVQDINCNYKLKKLGILLIDYTSTKSQKTLYFKKYNTKYFF